MWVVLFVCFVFRIIQSSSEWNSISVKFFTDCEEILLQLAVVTVYRQHAGMGTSMVEQVEANETETSLFLLWY